MVESDVLNHDTASRIIHCHYKVGEGDVQDPAYLAAYILPHRASVISLSSRKSAMVGRSPSIIERHCERSYMPIGLSVLERRNRPALRHISASTSLYILKSSPAFIFLILRPALATSHHATPSLYNAATGTDHTHGRGTYGHDPRCLISSFMLKFKLTFAMSRKPSTIS
jgi:hypothetical protein